MKTIPLIIASAWLTLSAFAQGTVNFLNGSYALISTNWSGGLMAPSPGSYFFGLFTASSTVTSATWQDLLTPTWTFTGIYATNIAAPGRLSGGANVATVAGWVLGATNSFLVAGWNAVMGHNWSTVATELSSGTAPFDGSWGISSVGFGAAGGGTAGLPAFSLWGIGPSDRGSPLTSGFIIGIAIPEPTLTALLSVSVLAFLIRSVGYRIGVKKRPEDQSPVDPER